MKRTALILALAVTAVATTATAQSAPLNVEIDRSARIALRGAAASVIVGNPAIADVSVIDAGKAVVSGRGYGVTNLVIIDQLGRTVLERQVVVAAPSEGRVSVIRGPKVSEYACAGGCERAGGGDGDSAKP